MTFAIVSLFILVLLQGFAIRMLNARLHNVETDIKNHNDRWTHQLDINAKIHKG